MSDPSDAPKSMSSFRSRVSGNFGIRIAGLGLQFLGSVLIARLLGVEALGVYTFAFTCVVITGILMSLGMEQLSVRELPRFIARGQAGLLRGFLTVQFGLILLISAAIAAVLLWLEGSGRLVFPIAAGWLVAGMVVHALILNVSAVLTGFQRVVQSQLMEALLRQVLFLSVLGLAIYLGFELGAPEVFGLSVVVGLSILICMMVLARRVLAELPTTTPEQDRRQLTPRLWLTASLPLLVMAFANQMQTNLDVLMLGVLAEAADVGRYRVASRGADLMLIANGVAVQVLGPMLSRALAGEDPEKARLEGQQLITQTAQLAAILGGGVFAALTLGATYYMALFGADFLSAAPALRILVAAQMVGILCGPVSVVLVTMGRERLVLLVAVTALILNTVLNLTLIPVFGIMGAAWATFVAVIFLQGVLMVCVLRTSGFDPTLRAMWRRDARPTLG